MHANAWLRFLTIALAALGIAACGEPAPTTDGGPATVRRLTEAQYRNAVADVFGNHIVVAGRFDPLIRTEGLNALGASRATITPSGIERFNAIARSIATQVVDQTNRGLLIPCVPAQTGGADPECARQFFAEAGRYLFRRPLNDDQLALYAGIAESAAETRKDFYAGLAYGLQGMLQAPEFLFVADSVEPDPGTVGGYRLDAYSKASRLSFLLWNSIPDDALLNAAESGALATDDGLAEQVDRMMASPRFKSGVRAFFTDMLDLEETDRLEKDTVIYPAFSLAAANDSREQLLRTLIDALVIQGGDYRDLFTTRKTFVTSALGLLYRVPVADPDGWTPYEFAEGDTRAGIQTQLSFVALHSHPGKSSPTLRGKAIRELLLCQKIPDPPSNVNFDQFNDPNSPNKTARDRLTAHNEDPACAGCHKLMDPIGLALENFDGAGQTRWTENGVTIDASGELNGTPFADAKGLGAALRNDPSATSCVANRLFAYATARPLEQNERPWMYHLEEQFAETGFRFPDLVRAIATSDALYAVNPAWVTSAALTEENKS